MTHWLEYGVYLSAVIWLIILLLPWRPWGVSEQMEPDGSDNSQADLSEMTVLIPARDEAGHIHATIMALLGQGTGHRIIVIDDQSNDSTGEIARQAGAEVIVGNALPAGWTGKLWALQQGLEQVRTPLVLQLDADIALKPGILCALVHKLKTENRALVSIMALLPTGHFWQRWLLPAYVWFFKMLYPFALANGRHRRFAAAAGGCILLRTDALRDTDGYHAIKHAVIDDCALAAAIKGSGHKIWIGLSRSVISRRASATLGDIANLVSRTAYTQLRHSFLLLLLVSILLMLVFWMPLAGLIMADVQLPIAALLSLLIMAVCYYPLMRFYRLPVWSGLCLPLIAMLYLGMTWLSAWRHWRGRGAHWKGRHYAKH